MPFLHYLTPRLNLQLPGNQISFNEHFSLLSRVSLGRLCICSAVENFECLFFLLAGAYLCARSTDEIIYTFFVILSSSVVLSWVHSTGIDVYAFPYVDDETCLIPQEPWILLFDILSTLTLGFCFCKQVDSVTQTQKEKFRNGSATKERKVFPSTVDCSQLQASLNGCW